MVLPIKPGSHHRGFTLVEMLIVVTILGILASLAVPYLSKQIRRSKESVLRENLFTLRDVIDQYYADKGRYPTSLQALVAEHYIRAVPKDPFTGSADTWVTLPPPDGGEGVYDVKSGSDGVDSSGVPYREW